MIATAGFAGLRNGELRAFAVENCDGEAILIAKSAWRVHVRKAKTKASRAALALFNSLDYESR